MGEILSAKNGRKSVLTYSSYQTVKYHLKSRNTNAINFFRRCRLKNLYSNLRSSSRKYRRTLKKNDKSLVSKVKHRADLEERMFEIRQRHIQRMQRIGVLNDLAKQVKSRNRNRYRIKHWRVILALRESIVQKWYIFRLLIPWYMYF